MKMDFKKAGCFIIALMLCVGLGFGCAKEEPEPAASETPVQTASAEPTPSPSPSPEAYTVLSESAQGPEVKALQEELMKLGYLVQDKATDYYGSMTRLAVAAFQKQNALQADGIAGEKTQKLLYSGNAKECDPFSKVAPTVDMTFEELVMSDDGTRDQYPEGFPAADTYKIIVDIEHQVTMVYSRDENGDYTVPVRYMLCSTGKDDCTPKGTFKMDNYHVRFSQFARDKTYGQYWTQIEGAIYFHTILYKEFDTSTYIDEVWEKMGTADSHGCIRLTVPDAKWMWFNIAPGTTCVIRDGDADDEETAAIRRQLVLAGLPEERPDVDPQNIPSTDNWSVSDVAHDVPFVQGSQD